VRFVAATVYCSVACTITLERTGTAATETDDSAAIAKLNDGSSSSAVKVFRSSDSASGTVIAKYVLTAGEKLPITLNDMSLDRKASANVSLGTDSITGDVKIFLLWYED
jgi:hypothetical protein